MTEDPSMDLSSWFERHGIVVSQKKAKPEEHSGSLSEVTWSDLRPLIAMARINEASFSQQPGMEKLMTDRRAYPINFNGISLMALLPRDLKPLRINEITDSEAESKIKILRRVRTGLGDSRWVLIWPHSGL
ncbi:hypothetical protein [Oligoflexus tunisiensis]|uniref:hypothetical protein n=1 Tax=Oligoflexus tunisiensis TaxID=708132 RepID=UPI001C4065ED|nr:hypothetical protein [Oligoflexus tunisiensis]